MAPCKFDEKEQPVVYAPTRNQFFTKKYDVHRFLTFTTPKPLDQHHQAVLYPVQRDSLEKKSVIVPVM